MTNKPTNEELEQKVIVLEEEISRLKELVNTLQKDEGQVHSLAENAEEALRMSEDKFRSLVEITGDWVWEIDLEGVCRYVNPGVKDLLGYDPEEIIGTYILKFAAEKEVNHVKAFFKEKSATQEAFAGWQISMVHKDGHPMVMEINATPMFDANGKPVGWYGLAKDITQRKIGEKALIESEGRFRSLIELTSDWVWEINSKGNFTYADPKITEFLGYKPEEVIGRSSIEFMDDAEKERTASFFRKLSRKMEPFTLFENIQTHKDGRKIVIETSGVPIFDSEGSLTGWRGIDTDITERRREVEEKTRLRSKLNEAQKMESIGTLAGGIAHEFNNAIVAVSGNIELLQMEKPEDRIINKYAESMKTSTHRMTRLTSQLLAYAGGGKYQTKTISLNDFAIETLSIVQHNIDPEIRVETDLASEVLNIRVDLTQFQMVISSILANASEAIKGRGKIRIKTCMEEISDTSAKINPDLSPGSYVRLTIEDNGKGMEKGIKSRIFEPFFTTKFQGRGLGMAAVYGIIKNHNGSITVDSEPNTGTQVSIFLPIELKEPKKTSKSKDTVTTGTGTILIIEDEEIVREVTRAMLEKLGYRILETETAKQAIKMVESFDGDIDLALLDIKLPDMEGGNLYPLMKKARPHLKVIVCSGYALDGPAQDLLDAGADGFLQKPFSITTLSEKLKKLLEKQVGE